MRPALRITFDNRFENEVRALNLFRGIIYNLAKVIISEKGLDFKLRESDESRTTNYALCCSTKL